MDAMSAAADFQFLPPTPAQRASYHTAPNGDSTLEFSWVPDLGSLHPVAPIELTADRSSTTSLLVFPPMDPLDVPVWNEVKVPNQSRAMADNVSRFDSGLQHDQLESV